MINIYLDNIFTKSNNIDEITRKVYYTIVISKYINNKNNTKIINDLITSINAQKINYLKNIINFFIKKNKLDIFFNTLIQNKNFTTNTLFIIIDSSPNIKEINNILFNISYTKLKLFNYKWFLYKSNIGILINKINSKLFSTVNNNNLIIADNLNINSSIIFFNANKYKLLFINNIDVKNLWLDRLLDHSYNYDYTNNYNYDYEIFMLFIINILLYSYNFIINNPLKYSTNINFITKYIIRFIDVFVSKSIANLHIQLKELNLYTNNKEKITRIYIFLYNKKFINKINIFIDNLIIRNRLDENEKNILTRFLINYNNVFSYNLYENINFNDTKNILYLTETQFNLLIETFIYNVKHNAFNLNFINNIINTIVFAYNFYKYEIINENLLTYFIYYYHDDTEIFNSEKYINFLLDLINETNTIDPKIKDHFNKFVYNINILCKENLEDIIIYIPKINNFRIFIKLKAFNVLSSNRKYFQIVNYVNNKNFVKNATNRLNKLLILIFDLVFDFKNIIDDIVVKNIVNTFNYFLNNIINNKFNLIKCKEYVALQYYPKYIIKKIIHIYTEFDSDNFINILVESQYMNIENYKYISNIIDNKTFKLYYLLKFNKMISKMNENKIKKIPEKYLDPLTYEIMKDPVELPNSKIILDKTTILNVLIDKNIDPYDRTFLTEDMLINKDDLKYEINEFIKS